MKKPYTLERKYGDWRSFVPNPYSQICFTLFGWRPYRKYATLKQAKDALKTQSVSSKCRKYARGYLMGNSYRILLPDETYLYYKDCDFIHIH